MAKMGEAEITRWMAFYELQQEDEANAIKDAEENR